MKKGVLILGLLLILSVIILNQVPDVSAYYVTDCGLCPNTCDPYRCALSLSVYSQTCRTTRDCTRGGYCLYNAGVSGRCGQQLCGNSNCCDANNWGGWSGCSAGCGGGQQCRTNDCGQQQCQSCNTHSCCNPSWYAVGGCSAPCGGGTQTWYDGCGSYSYSSCNTQSCCTSYTWYYDPDSDGYYNGTTQSSCTSPGAGWINSSMLGSPDCSPNNAAIYPGASEICNAVDDNCDGSIDEGQALPLVNFTSPISGSNFNYNVNSNYTISGSNLLNCYWNLSGSGTNNAVACSNGVISGQTWSQGTNTVYLSSSGCIASNRVSTSVLFNIDTIAPFLRILYPNSGYFSNPSIPMIINASDIHLSGTNCYSITTPLNQAMTPNVPVFMDFNQGENVLHCNASDSFGNSNYTNVTFWVDSIAPAVVITNPANDGQLFNIDTMNIDYSISDIDLQSCFWTRNNGLTNNSVLCSATSITGQTWNQGLNTVIVYARDNANNLGSATRSFSVDSIAPTLVINSPINNQNYSSRDRLLDITSDGNNIWYSLDNGASNTTYSAPGTVTFNEGSNTLQAWASDLAGNVNSSSITFFVDSIAPFVNITSPASDGLIFNSSLVIAYSMSDSGAGLASCDWSSNYGLTNNSFTCGANIIGFNFTEGANSITIFARDGLGNMGSDSRNFVIDIQAPQITILNPLINDIVGWAVIIRADINESNINSNGVSFEIINSSGNTIFSQVMNDLGGNIYNGTFYTNETWPYDSSLLNSINLTLRVYANDILGHLSNASRDFTLDNTQPAIQVATPLTLGGWYNNDFNMEVYVDNHRLNYTRYTITNSFGTILQTNSINLAQPSYVWSDLINSSTYVEGDYYLNVYARDSSNPQNENNKTVMFGIDQTNPTLAIISPTNSTYNTLTPLLNISANDAHLSSVGYSLNGGAYTVYVPGTILVIEGSNSITAWANDSAGNMVSANVTFFVDSIYPTISFVNPTENSSLINRNEFYVNVSAADANGLSLFTIFLYNTTGEADISNTTEPFFANFSSLPDGTYSFFATACDTTGLCNSTETRVVTIDITPPALSIIEPTNISYSSQSRLLNISASDSHPMTVWYTLNGIESPYFSETSITGQEGSNIIFAYANDSAGNMVSANVTFFVDSIYPAISFVNPTENSSLINRNNFEVNVSALDLNGIASLVINLYNSAGLVNSTSIAGNNLYLNYQSLLDDSYYFNATACDTLGNCNSTETRVVTIDTTAPTLTIVSPANTTYNTRTILLDITSNGNNIWFSFDDGVSNFSYSVPNNSLFNEGSNTLYAWANDSAGNANSTSVTFFVDSISPQINITSPGNNITYNYVVNNFSYSYNESNPSSCWYSLNSANNISFTCGQNITFAVLPVEGWNTLIIYMNDSAGNINSSQIRFAIDTIPPSIQIISPADGVTYNYYRNTMTHSESDSFSQIDSCWYSTDNGANNITATCNSITPNLSSVEGVNTIFVWANDSAGNVGFNSTTYTVTIDRRIVNSTIYGAYFIANATQEIYTTLVTEVSAINGSQVNGAPVVDINDSFIYYSNLTNLLVINNCTILNSWMFGGTCINSYIDPSFISESQIIDSTVHDSNITDSVINQSFINDSEIIICNVSLSNISDAHPWVCNIYSSDVISSYINNSNISYSTVIYSNITNSTIIYSYIFNSTIFNSLIQNSTVNNSIVYDSIIIDSTILDSLINQSTIIDSIIIRSNITNSIINQSTVTDSVIINSNVTLSNITDSTIIDSTIFNSTIINSFINQSTITNSIIIDSNITLSNVTDSYVVNSTIFNATLIGANVTNDVIYNGTIIVNNITYNASINGSANLTNFINYGPTAVFNVLSSAYANDIINFDGSLSSDPNIPGMLADSLTYEFNFGNGNTYSESSVSFLDGSYEGNTAYVYSSPGFYSISLRVVDRFGLESIVNRTINISADTTSPQITILSPQAITYNDTLIDFTIALNENVSSCSYSLDGSGNVSLNRLNLTTFGNLVTVPIGSHALTFYCIDPAGNSNTSSVSFEVVGYCGDGACNNGESCSSCGDCGSCGGGGGGGGTSSRSVPTSAIVYIFDNNMTQESYSIDKEVIQIMLGEGYAFVRLPEIGKDSITLKFSPSLEQTTLKLGEVKKFELTYDGYYDISIYLKSIKDGKAEISLKRIKERLVDNARVVTIPAEEVQEEVSPGLTSSILWWILGIALAFVTIALLVWAIILLLRKQGIIGQTKKVKPYSLKELDE